MTPKKTPTTKERIGKIMRVNTYSVTHAITPTNKPVPVPALAAPPTNDLFERGVYVPGDGERMQSTRPGADDHLQYKSKGNQT